MPARPGHDGVIAPSKRGGGTTLLRMKERAVVPFRERDSRNDNGTECERVNDVREELPSEIEEVTDHVPRVG